VSASAKTAPLLRHGREQATFAIRDGETVSVARFLGDVTHLARRLPERSHVINYCADRYQFAVTFAAALVRKQISLLPPTQAGATIKALAADYPGVYAVADSATHGLKLETVLYSAPASERGSPADMPAFALTQTAVVVFTSGTTGQPMPHRKTWGSLVRSALVEGDRLATPANRDFGIVGTVPPQHMYGLESTLLLALQNALVLHAGRPFYPEDVRAALAQLPGQRMLVTTPVHLRALVADAVELPPIATILCATAPLADELAAEAERRFHAPVYEIYGCTEAGQVATRRTLACVYRCPAAATGRKHLRPRRPCRTGSAAARRGRIARRRELFAAWAPSRSR
jgi:acyl-coenzyme A synthetase/AMP-(fatty) acid ligase